MSYLELLCVGGGSHGCKVLVKRNQTYVSVRDPGQEQLVRPLDLCMLPAGASRFTYSSYNRRVLPISVCNYTVLVEDSLTTYRAQCLLQELLDEGKRP